MLIAEVIGTVVATQKHEALIGSKIQVVQPLDPKSGKPSGDPVVAVDSVGAGRGEKVLVAFGSNSSKAVAKENCPVDAAIVGIIDQLDIA